MGLVPSTIFDRTADRLRTNPRWTVREISGGHNMNRHNPEGLANLLLELFPSSEPVAAGVRA